MVIALLSVTGSAFWVDSKCLTNMFGWNQITVDSWLHVKSRGSLCGSQNIALVSNVTVIAISVINSSELSCEANKLAEETVILIIMASNLWILLFRHGGNGRVMKSSGFSKIAAMIN